MDELKGEKIDIIIWDKDYKVFLANSLSPSEVIKVFAKEKEKTARIIVPDDQLSLAIGKEGQNARLAAKLTGWKIDLYTTQICPNTYSLPKKIYLFCPPESV